MPQYNGAIVSVSAGDEIAMNSMVLSVVSIDGAGNGEGLIKIPMMNNIKLGVTLSGIKVAEGGCVVAGKAELSGVSASILTDKQRVNLEKAYTAYNQILDVAYENAGAIAETINGLKEFMQKAKEFAKNYKGGTAEAAKAKAYEKELKKAQKLLRDSPDVPAELKTALTTAQANAQTAWDFYKTGQPCSVSGNSGGGNAFFKLPLADCGQYATLIETEIQAMEAASLEIDCNCVGTPSDCNEITQIMNRIKSANASESKLVTFYKNILLTDYRNEGISGLTGIDIGGKCYHLHIENNFSTGTINLDMADFQIDKTSQTIHIKDKNGIVAVSIHRLPKTRGTFDELVAYLGFGAKKPNDRGYTPPEGAVDVSLLKTSELGKKMLRISEGCTATAPKKDRREGYLYVDSKGYCTFGIGHLIRKADCTKEDEAEWGKKTWDEALADFEHGKLKEFEEIVQRHVKVPVTQAEFDAMVSFAFNVGEGNISDNSPKNDGFQGSNFMKTLNGKVPNKPKGTREPDLMYNFKDNPNRRKSEVELFKTGDYKHYPGGEGISTLKIACDGK
ncbi:MAG: lysozyme [Spirosomataceae bacterium]